MRPDDLTKRNTPLEMDSEEFRALGYRLVDSIACHFETIATRPVTPGESVSAVRRAVGTETTLPPAGMDPDTLLREMTDTVLQHSLFNAHPRFWGYITAGPAPIGVLADLLASAVNANVGAWKLAPAATEIEAQTVRWVAELIGYPAECGGLMVSGGNMANFICFLAARRAMADWDVRACGLHGNGSQRLRIYASTATHTWIQKAADLFGHGTDAIRWVATDREQRMDVDVLRRQIIIDRDRALPARVRRHERVVARGVHQPGNARRKPPQAKQRRTGEEAPDIAARSGDARADVVLYLGAHERPQPRPH
jgi:glutamate/tyrosine decarboxylase-like PLP-dependent enzyme